MFCACLQLQDLPGSVWPTTVIAVKLQSRSGLQTRGGQNTEGSQKKMLELYKTIAMADRQKTMPISNPSMRVVRENTMLTRKGEIAVLSISKSDQSVRIQILNHGQIIDDRTFKLDYSEVGYANTTAFEVSKEGVIFRFSEEDYDSENPHGVFPVYHLTIVDLLLRTLGAEYQNGPDTLVEHVVLNRSAFPPRFLISSNASSDSDLDPGCFLIEATGANYLGTHAVAMSLKEVDLERFGVPEVRGDFGFDAAFPTEHPIAAINHGEFIGIWKWSAVDCADGDAADLVEVVNFRGCSDKESSSDGASERVLCVGEQGRFVVFTDSGTVVVHAIGQGRQDTRIACLGSVKAATLDASEVSLAVLAGHEVILVDLEQPERQCAAELSSAGNVESIDFLDTRSGKMLIARDEKSVWVFKISGVGTKDADVQLRLLIVCEASGFLYSDFSDVLILVSDAELSIFRLSEQLERASPDGPITIATQPTKADWISEWKTLLEFGSDDELQAHFALRGESETERNLNPNEALICSIEAFRPKGAELTSNAGADPFASVNSYGLSPLNLALINVDEECARAMLKLVVHPTSVQRSELVHLRDAAGRLVHELESKFDAEFGSGLDAAYPIGELISRLHWDAMKAKISEAQTLRRMLGDAVSVR